MENVLAWLDKVPWELLLTVLVIPYLRSLQAKIKDEELRRLYIRLVRWAEMTYGAGKGAAKKKLVVEELKASGLTPDSKLLEAAVHEATKEVF